MEDIKILKLSRSSFDYYRKNVGLNSNITMIDAQTKLTRNKILALPYKMSKGKTWYAYGNLRFMIKDDVIEWIENGHSQHPKWTKDINKYKELSKRLGIKTTQKIRNQ